MKKINILIADDHTMFRESLKQVINSKPGYKIIAEAGSGDEVIDLAGKFLPDIILMDINMPGKNGIEAAREIKQKWNKIKIIIITMLENELYIVDALKSNVEGFIYKDAQINELFKAIDEVYAGNKYITDEIKEKVIEYITGKNYGRSINEDSEKIVLTPRQVEIIKYASQGFTSREIAEKLYLSELTVIKHRKNIIKKLGLKNFTEVVSFAHKKGII
ncbi:transcriptional regulatory protein DegU [bacterium BMS3Abin04]|nr:transcriptional regulatory protein DegU [bacterium BMS3Abin04]